MSAAHRGGAREKTLVRVMGPHADRISAVNGEFIQGAASDAPARRFRTAVEGSDKFVPRYTPEPRPSVSSSVLSLR